LSGFPPRPFLFEGFLPKRKGERRRRLEELRVFDGAIVFYLSPHGPEKVLEDILQSLGNRRAVILREISKLHQERIPGDVASLLAYLSETSLKGELVLVTGPAAAQAEGSGDWEEVALGMLEEGLSEKEVVRKLTEEYGISKNKAKGFLLDKKREREAL
jgi:16S rRNA (cytidine1402-2'-O)-methyltransferase